MGTSSLAEVDFLESGIFSAVSSKRASTHIGWLYYQIILLSENNTIDWQTVELELTPYAYLLSTCSNRPFGNVHDVTEIIKADPNSFHWRTG